MSNIRKFQVKHSDDVVSFDIEVNMDADASFPLENYAVKTYGPSIKTDIVEMSTFWHGSPSIESCFERHLNFFLGVLRGAVAHIAIDKFDSPEFIHAYLNESEGYAPVFGDGIKISNVSVCEDYVADGLSIEEVK